MHVHVIWEKINVYQWNRYITTYIEVCIPQNLRDYVEQASKQNRKPESFGVQHVVQELNAGSVLFGVK